MRFLWSLTTIALLASCAASRSLESSTPEPVHARARHVKEEPAPASATPPAEATREPARVNTGWVCEVEANSKVFTGIGLSRDEALGAAKSTCVSHLQGASCAESDCKQNL